MADITLGAASTFHTGSIDNVDVAMLDDTHFVVVFRDLADGNAGKAVVGTVVDGVVTGYGSVVEFGSSVAYASVSRLDDTRFIVGYVNTASGNNTTVRAGSVSGTTVSFPSSAGVIEATSGSFVRVIALDNSRFAIRYNANAYSFIKAGNVSGTTIGSLGSRVTVVGGPSNFTRMALIASNRVAAAHQEKYDKGYVHTFDITGTSITISGSSIFNTPTTADLDICVLGENKFAIAFKNDGGSDQGQLRVAQWNSAYNITMGAISTFKATATTKIAMEATGDSSVVISYRDDVATIGKSIIGTIDGLTVSGYGDEATHSDGDTGASFWATQGMTAVSFSSVLVAYPENTTSGEVRVLSSPVPPSVTTQAVSAIGDVFATFNGDITSTGSEDVTVRGFYYKVGSTGDPTASDSVISSSGTFGAGAFTEAPTGLTGGTDYRVAAFATSSAGATVGPTVGFMTEDPAAPTVTTQAASAITETSVTFNGSITGAGYPTPTVRGFYYLEGTTGTPGPADMVVSETGSFSSGAFTEDLSDLTPGTDYRVVAFSTNATGTGTGAVVDVHILDTPEVTTGAATDVQAVSAAFNGEITDAGGVSTSRGFYYKVGTTGDPTAADSVLSESGSFTDGPFSLGATSLSPDEGYRVAAFVTNADGTAVGATVDVVTYKVFSTTTDAVSGITGTTADGNGTIVKSYSPVTVRGFYYMEGTTGDPTASDSIVSETGDFSAGAYSLEIPGLTPGADYRVAAFSTDGVETTVGATVGFTTTAITVPVSGTTGDMSARLSPLLPNTTYYVRPFATNGVGTTYGDEAEFTTGPERIPTTIFMDGGATA